MSKKLMLVVAAAIFLGGCNVNNVWQKEAAKDEKSSVTQGETQIETAPSVSEDSSIETLEADIEGTVIYDEDFSDLE